MSKATPATRTLDAANSLYTLHRYVYDPSASNIGQHAADALGAAPERVFKTLMIEVDGHPACAIVPVCGELSLKKVASALGGKHASMMSVPKAERSTGYHVGGISPLGQKKRVPIVLDDSVLAHTTIFCNGGQRGLQIEIAPSTLISCLQAKLAAIAGD